MTQPLGAPMGHEVVGIRALSHSDARPPALAQWAVFVAAALVALEFLDLAVYGVVVPIAAAALYLATGRIPGPTAPRTVDRRDLQVMGGVYLVVVTLFFATFRLFSTDTSLGCFCASPRGLCSGSSRPSRTRSGEGVGRSHL